MQLTRTTLLNEKKKCRYRSRLKSPQKTIYHNRNVRWGQAVPRHVHPTETRAHTAGALVMREPLAGRGHGEAARRDESRIVRTNRGGGLRSRGRGGDSTEMQRNRREPADPGDPAAARHAQMLLLPPAGQG